MKSVPYDCIFNVDTEDEVKTRVQKWGNSLAIRIPAGLAREAAMIEGTAVDVDVENGSLRIVRETDVPTLDELIAAITEDNRHEFVDFGPPVGRELL